MGQQESRQPGKGTRYDIIQVASMWGSSGRPTCPEAGCSGSGVGR